MQPEFIKLDAQQVVYAIISSGAYASTLKSTVPEETAEDMARFAMLVSKAVYREFANLQAEFEAAKQQRR